MRHRLPAKIKFITPVFLGTGLLISIVAVVLAASVRELPARLETETTTMQSTTRIVSGNGRYVPTRQAAGARRHPASAFAKSLFEPLEPRTLLSGSSALVQELLGDRATLVDEISRSKESVRYEQFANPRIHGPLRLLDPRTVSLPPKGEKPQDRPKGDDPRDGGAGAGGGESDPPPRSPSDFRYVLRPGSGFTGTTPTPPARGSGLGATKDVIADWDVVPYTAFNDSFNVGVVAWHINQAGIDRVDFSVNGGTWTSVRDMATNPQSGVVEYYATLRAELFNAGPVEVRAIAYPVVGQPVVLSNMKLYADPTDSFAGKLRYVTTTGNDSTGNGTQGNPFRTISKAATSLQSAYGNADGGTIYLGAGSYDATHNVDTSQTHLTIAANPGLTRNQVSITNWSGTRTRLTHVQGVTLRTGLPVRSTSDLGQAWIDNSDLIGGGRLDQEQWVAPQWNGTYWVTGAYMTDVDISNSFDGQRNAALIRNAKIHGIGSNFITGTWTSINVECWDVDPGSSGAHPDVYHGYGALPDTIIMYGVQAGVRNNDGLGASRGINAFDSPGSNLAIIDTIVDCHAGWGTSLELGNCDNVLIKDSTFISNVQLHAELPHSNTVFENVSLPTGSNPAPGNVSGITVR